MNSLNLNRMQQKSVEKGSEYYNDYINYSSGRRWFEISGAAGTGKTTTVKALIERIGCNLNNVLFMAYVGKATLALSMTGLNAQTIHSGIYRLAKVPKIIDGQYVKKNGVIQLCNDFVLKDKLDKDYDAIVVDEGGMVPYNMGADILAFNKPTFVLGDLDQLPPVFGQPYFLVNPDVILDEIMRQAKDSSIVYLSQLAKYGIPIPYGVYGDNECTVLRRSELKNVHLKNADLILCAKNTTRDTFNKHIRENIYGIKGEDVQVGDKVICRKNRWDITLKNNDNIALVNGLVGTVTRAKRNYNNPSTSIIDFKPEFTEEQFENQCLNRDYLFSPYNVRKTTNTLFLAGTPYEFGYVLTCHLAQGSQADNVLVIDEKCGDSNFHRKWLYTAITRAKKKLTIVV